MSVEQHEHHVMEDIEGDYEVQDDSRPFFQRQACEIGIYMTVYEVTPIDEVTIGLPHYFRMRTTDILHEQFCKLDTVNIRASFERKKLLTDTYIERFEPGIVMAVGVDTVEALDALWDIHRHGQLNGLMQDSLISSEVLNEASITAVKLDTKLWDDEYDACKQELFQRTVGKTNIQHGPNDLKMAKRLKEYQAVIATEVSVMRDLDNEMELNRELFMNCIRNLLPNKTEQISTLNEYDKLAKSQKAKKLYYKDLLDLYSTIIKTWRSYYDTFELEIVTPFIQIHKICENEKRRDIKARIINNIKGMQEMLLPNADLQIVSHPEMERKVIKRDAPVFLGLLSLVPMAVDRIAEVDILIDEYMRGLQM